MPRALSRSNGSRGRLASWQRHDWGGRALSTISPSTESGGFEQQHATLAAVGADADDGALAPMLSPWHRSQFLDGLADDARAGGAERMADRRAAAVGIQAFPREGAEIPRHLGPIAQEGFVLQR